MAKNFFSPLVALQFSDNKSLNRDFSLSGWWPQNRETGTILIDRFLRAFWCSNRRIIRADCWRSDFLPKVPSARPRKNTARLSLISGIIDTAEGKPPA